MSAAPAPLRPIGQESEEVTYNESRWLPMMRLPCEFSVDVPVPGFKVRDFLALRVGSIIHTCWRLTNDVPLRINGTLIGWGELESTSTHLAVRLTEIA